MTTHHLANCASRCLYRDNRAQVKAISTDNGEVGINKRQNTQEVTRDYKVKQEVTGGLKIA